MSVIFKSIIKSNPVGRWYIEIRDTSEEDSTQMCLDFEEYIQKIEEMGAPYGPDVEVQWSAEENVTPEQINEVRMKIAMYQAEQEQKEQESEI